MDAETRSKGLTASVVIATYNRAAFVRTCLEHLQRQTRAPLQILVVDASAGPETAAVVRDFPGVEYLRNDKGPGSTATSRAVGAARAGGEILAFVDDDAFAEPDWLEHLLAPYVDPAVAAVGGRALNGRPGEDTEGVGEVGLLLPNGQLTGFFAADTGRVVDVDHMLGANMSVRRRVVEDLGGIHDHYPGTCLREETDIALRIRRAGHRIVYTPFAVVHHVAGPYARGRRFDTRYKYYGARNHIVLLVHTLGWGDPRVGRYLATATIDMLMDVRDGVRALGDPDRTTPRDRARGLAGGLLRAAVKKVGLVAGCGAAARITWGERQRVVARED